MVNGLINEPWAGPEYVRLPHYTTTTIIIELSGKGAGKWYKRWCGGNKKNVSSEYLITRGFGNSRQPRVARCGILSGRKRRKAGDVRPFMGRAGCPIREPYCRIAAGALKGISARRHAENSWGDCEVLCNVLYISYLVEWLRFQCDKSSL